MSWRDRPYAGDDYSQPALRPGFRRPSTAVMWLIIANVAAFFLDTVLQHVSARFPHQMFGLSLAGINRLWLWQPVTYMFMHAGVWHLLLNMLGLYIFGSEFERAFGRDRFLQFYATCGLVGGLAYLGLAVVDPAYGSMPIVGASGAVYGLLVAAIIFFPHIQVILFIFPMPIRVFGLILAAILLLQLISPGGIPNKGGEVCHIAGAATGLMIFYAWGVLPKIGGVGGRGLPAIPIGRRRSGGRSEGTWARRQKKLAEERTEVDRILAKVHEQGLQSLTRREKKRLARATKHQQEDDRQLGRIDRL